MTENSNSNRKIMYAGVGISIGAGIGFILGLILFDNMVLGMGAGAGIGLIVGAVIDLQGKN